MIYDWTHQGEEVAGRRVPLKGQEGMRQILGEGVDDPCLFAPPTSDATGKLEGGHDTIKGYAGWAGGPPRRGGLKGRRFLT